MKSNADKANLLVSANEKVTIKIGNHEIVNTKREKVLGIHFDSELSFNYHISDICKKARRQVCALPWMTLNMDLSKKHGIMNEFFRSQFNIAHLFWCPISAIIVIKPTDVLKIV